jgi:hypothetical protein
VTIRLAALLAAAAGATAVALAAAPTARRQDGAVASAPPASARPFGVSPQGVYTPATSCAAASCHNGGQVGREGSEFSTWADGDPHRKAFSVLYNEDSTRIMRNLAAGEPGRWTAKAHQEALCLKCHAVNEEKDYHGERVAGRAVADGVDCNGCHGPGKAWLSVHYQDGWKALTDREKFERYGFLPTKDLVARALNCAGCHVGQRDREVNHDLIAAGHPRLAFEYTRYHYQPQYTKHWQERLPNPAFELKAWLVGEVASLRAACDLLAARAERAVKRENPWPELSEHSCYACHQGIGGAGIDSKQLRSSPAAADRPQRRTPGVPGWQVWYSSLTDALPAASQVLLPGDPPSFARTVALRDLMNKSFGPNPAEVRTAATAAAAELDGWLAKVQAAGYSGSVSAADAVRLAAEVTKSAVTADGKLRDYDWDFVAQHALALTAAYHAAGGAGEARVAAWKPHLEALRAATAFQVGRAERFDSPQSFDPADPRTYHPSKAAEPFRQLFKLTHPGQ